MKSRNVIKLDKSGPLQGRSRDNSSEEDDEMGPSDKEATTVEADGHGKEKSIDEHNERRLADLKHISNLHSMDKNSYERR